MFHILPSVFQYYASTLAVLELGHWIRL